jgi:putative two-component system response regulator
MQRHTVIGAELLAGGESELIVLARDIALMHHERWDGLGYPSGMRGEDIPREARICAVCDVWDALVSPRPYKRAWSFAEAAAELERMSGAALDPRLVPEFLSAMTEVAAEYPGTEARSAPAPS